MLARIDKFFKVRCVIYEVGKLYKSKFLILSFYLFLSPSAPFSLLLALIYSTIVDFVLTYKLLL